MSSIAVRDCLESVFCPKNISGIISAAAQYWVTSDGPERGQEQVGGGGGDLGSGLICIFRNTRFQTMLMLCFRLKYGPIPGSKDTRYHRPSNAALLLPQPTTMCRQVFFTGVFL